MVRDHSWILVRAITLTSVLAGAEDFGQSHPVAWPSAAEYDELKETQQEPDTGDLPTYGVREEAPWEGDPAEGKWFRSVRVLLAHPPAEGPISSQWDEA